MDCTINDEDNESSFIATVLESINTPNLDGHCGKEAAKVTTKTSCCKSSSLIPRSTYITRDDSLADEDNVVPQAPAFIKGKERWRSAAHNVIRQLRTRLLSDPTCSAPLPTISDLNESSEDNVTEHNHVEHSSIIKSSIGSTSSLFDPWHDFMINCAPMEIARRYRFSSLHQRWIIDEVRVKIESKAFDHGAMRECFRMKKLPNNGAHRNDWRYASNYVAKRYMNPDTEHSVYFEDVQLQMEAKLWAERFNRCNPPKKVDVFQVSILEFHHRPAMPLYHMERYMGGTYKKYNSNSGFVEKTNCRNTPQAFSHFTFEHSGHKLLIVDIQGVDDLYTDPQIHTSDSKGYGDGNLGPRGMALFFHSHRCNSICEYLGLSEFQLASSEMAASFQEEPSPGALNEFKEVRDWHLALSSSNDEDEGNDKAESTSLLEICRKVNDSGNMNCASPNPPRLYRTRCFSTGDQGTQVRYGTGMQIDWRPLQHTYLNKPPTNMVVQNSYYCSFDSNLNAPHCNEGPKVHNLHLSNAYEESGFSEGDELDHFQQDDLEIMLSDFNDGNKCTDHANVEPFPLNAAAVSRRVRGISTCSEDVDCIASGLDEKEENWPPHAVQWLRNKSPSIPIHISAPVKQMEQSQLHHYSTLPDEKCDVAAKIHYELASLHASGRFRDSNEVATSNKFGDIDWNAALFHMRHAARLGCTEALWEMVCFAEPRSQLLLFGNCAPSNESVLHSCCASVDEEDEQNAWEYLRQVAYRGHNLKAMYIYARICESGNEKYSQISDLGEALRWYQRALTICEHNDLEEDFPVPCYEVYAHMARIYMEGGTCLDKDWQKAGELYTKAAESATTALKGRLASKYFSLAEDCYSAATVDDKEYVDL